ncbi:MAG: SH3 domain-containing protein [Clostridia bacterium]
MKNKKTIKNVLILAGIAVAALFFINMSFASSDGKVNVETANIRETADENAKILEQLSQGDNIEILEKQGNWYKIKSKGITGYLREDLIEVKNEEKTVETSATVETEKQESTDNDKENNVQETTTEETSSEEKTKKVSEDTKLKIVPAINATDILEVKKDEEVTITESLGDWVCIQTSTTKGWIRADKLKSVKEEKQEETKTEEQPQVEEKQETLLKKAYVNTQTANMRKEANTASEIVTSLALNTEVEVYAEENGWSKIKVNGQEGYISTALLSDKKTETSRSLETPRKKAESTTTENTSTKKETTIQSTTSTTAQTSGKGATVVATAKNYIGSKYVYGATGPNSFDCSGFTQYVFKLHGVSLNRTAAAQYSNGVAVDRVNLQPGDLVMFGKSGINHVGIYIGGGQIVHAANPSRGVTIDTITSGYYNNNYVGARRVM